MADHADGADFADSSRGIVRLDLELFGGRCPAPRAHIVPMVQGELIHARLTQSVIGAFFDVYNELDVGYLECLYAAALERELLGRGHRVAREVRVMVFYKGAELGCQRLDMVVDDLLVVEIKSTAELHADAWRQ